MNATAAETVGTVAIVVLASLGGIVVGLCAWIGAQVLISKVKAAEEIERFDAIIQGRVSG